MNDRDVRAVLYRLIPSLAGEGDWDDVVRRSATPVRLVSRRRARPRSATLIAAAIVLVSITALVVSTPWRGGPTVLERAGAAISAPAGSHVLHEAVVIKWLGPHKSRGQAKLE